MINTLNLGLPSDVDDLALAEVISAIRVLDDTVEAKLGLRLPVTLNQADYPPQGTINSQDVDKLYCKITTTPLLGVYVTLSNGASGLECHAGGNNPIGFVSKILDINSGFVAVSTSGINDNFAGLVVGESYFLGANGGVSLTGTIKVGVAVSESAILTRLS